MADVLIAPYLPVGQETQVGPWSLVPFSRIAGPKLLPGELRARVIRLIEAYQMPAGAGQPLGVLAVPEGELVGASFDRTLMSRLGHALMAGVVSGNPMMFAGEGEEEDTNAGWGAATVENALLYGHPLVDSDSYAVEIGVLVRFNSIRHAPGDEPLPKVEPPVELPRPMFAQFDGELAGATYEALSGTDAPGRRLHRALDWYRIALSNAQAVTLDVRVGATRSAFELLTDAGDETKRLVRAYGELMRGDAAGSETYEDVFWAKGPVQMSADEWWMTRLCELRNAIVHGDEVPAELWEHEDRHQLDHIHDNLVVALRRSVAGLVGNPSLRLGMLDRVWARAAQQAADSLARRGQAGES
jgi:hypothetical protein